MSYSDAWRVEGRLAVTIEEDKRKNGLRLFYYKTNQ